MLKRPNLIAFSLVLVLGFIILNLPHQLSARIKLSLGSLFVPLFGLNATVEEGGDRALQTFLPRRELVRQLQALRKENQRLRVEAQHQEALQRENEKLRRAIGWRERTPWKLKLGRVIARDPANWWRTLQIDMGSRDGLVPDLPVLTQQGLVGKVSVVGYSRSQVLLIGDPNCRVSALVHETRDNGIIAPSSSTVLDHQLVDLTYLPSGSLLQPGQVVVASGLGGVFPKGYPIGRIVDTRSIGYGLYLEARVKLNVNLNRLEEVWVKLP